MNSSNFINICTGFFCLMLCHLSWGQDFAALEINNVQNIEDTNQSRSKGEYANVNQCTPWHHMKCVYTTGKETYESGRAGERSKHWWRMSYIGQACEDKYGRKKAVVFESIFVIPHYLGVAFSSEVGKLVYSIRGPSRKK